MPSEFNHMDDFFRKKEEEVLLDLGSENAHWAEMRLLLKKPQARPRIKTQLYVAAAVMAVLGVSAFLLLNRNGKPVDKPGPVVIKTTVKKPSPIDPVPLTKDSFIIAQTSPRPHNVHTSVKKMQQPVKLPFPEIGKDIPLYPSKDSVQLAQADPAKLLEAFFDKLSKPAQVFTVRPDRDTLLLCKEGTTLFIPAASFQSASGLQTTASVMIYVREFYEFSDILSNKLTTSSNGRPIATAGMLHIEARAGEESVFIKPGASLQLEMPAAKTVDTLMQLFTAQSKQPSDEGAYLSADLNWLPAGQQQVGKRIPKIFMPVTDLMNDPREIIRRKGKKIGKFILSYSSKLSIEEARAELQKRYGSMYTEIRVHYGIKRLRYEPKNMPIPQDDFVDGMIGETIYMNLAFARKYDLISVKDSIGYASKSGDQGRLGDFLFSTMGPDKYRFSLTGLGWINCDRFLDYPRTELTDLFVKLDSSYENAYAYPMLIFKKENLVMPGVFYNGKISFRNVPLNREVSLACVAVKNGKIVASLTDFTVSSSSIPFPQFEETSPEEWKRSLKKFGNVGR